MYGAKEMSASKLIYRDCKVGVSEHSRPPGPVKVPVVAISPWNFESSFCSEGLPMIVLSQMSF